MKKIGQIIAGEYFFYFIYALLFFYLFSITFLDLNFFFTEKEQRVLFTLVPIVWVTMMYSKVGEFDILNSAINWFNLLSEKEKNGLYSFPKKITYTDGKTSYANGKIKINNTIFSKFTFNEPLKYISQGNGYELEREVHPPLINCGFSQKKDICIGVIGLLIMLNFSPTTNIQGIMLFFSIIAVGSIGIVTFVILGSIPSLMDGLRERVATKLNALNEDVIDKNIKNVLVCWIRDPNRNCL